MSNVEPVVVAVAAAVDFAVVVVDLLALLVVVLGDIVEGLVDKTVEGVVDVEAVDAVEFAELVVNVAVARVLIDAVAEVVALLKAFSADVIGLAAVVLGVVGADFVEVIAALHFSLVAVVGVVNQKLLVEVVAREELALVAVVVVVVVGGVDPVGADDAVEPDVADAGIVAEGPGLQMLPSLQKVTVWAESRPKAPMPRGPSANAAPRR
mmetsp:Transcript_1857/g.5388  ORF Transcript_1857/g.5388 Transcript_1857/m.5388 type:complete len:209 (-) Transcript_1857:212-838(-)